MQGLLSSAHIVAAFYMHSTTNNCNNPIKTILRAWLGSINGRAFFKRLDPEKVSIVKAWSFQAIRFIRTVSPSASARPLMPPLLPLCAPVSERNHRVSQKNNHKNNPSTGGPVGVVTELLLTLLVILERQVCGREVQGDPEFGAGIVARHSLVLERQHQSLVERTSSGRW